MPRKAPSAASSRRIGSDGALRLTLPARRTPPRRGPSSRWRGSPPCRAGRDSPLAGTLRSLSTAISRTSVARPRRSARTATMRPRVTGSPGPTHAVARRRERRRPASSPPRSTNVSGAEHRARPLSAHRGAQLHPVVVRHRRRNATPRRATSPARRSRMHAPLPAPSSTKNSVSTPLAATGPEADFAACHHPFRANPHPFADRVVTGAEPRPSPRRRSDAFGARPAAACAAVRAARKGARPPRHRRVARRARPSATRKDSVQTSRTRALARRAVRRSGSTRYATASSPSPTAG